MNMIKWTERQWSFGYRKEYVPLLIERLSSTAPRIEELVKDIGEQALAHKEGETWSVKEHIGHLTDLEELHNGRIDDFKEGITLLRPADMTNKKTYEADHNQYTTAVLIENFRNSRNAFLQKIKTTAPIYFEHKAFHPRLKKEMTLVDLLYFIAEHDLQHLASISQSLRT